MPKNRFSTRSTKRFKKYEKSRGKWYFSTDFTLPDFIAANRHDPATTDIVVELKKLPVGASYVYDGGAGGVDKFTRVA